MLTNQNYPFIKYHKVLSYLFNPSEIVFILHMIDLESLRSKGRQIEWTRSFYMAKMGLKPYSFDKCIEKLTAMELLSKTNNADGNKVYYHFNMELYYRLLKILSASKDIYVMIAFCKDNFKQKKRPIMSITENEIIMLSKKKGA